MILKNLTTGIPVLQDGWITVVFWWVVFFFIILRKIEFSFGGWGREEVVAGTPFWGYAQELGQVRIPYEWTLAAVTPELDFMMYCIIPFQVFHTFSISPCNMDFCWQRLERRGKNSECAKDTGPGVWGERWRALPQGKHPVADFLKYWAGPSAVLRTISGYQKKEQPESRMDSLYVIPTGGT